MTNLLHTKMFICKLLTCWILSVRLRKYAHNFLFWFSFKDYKRFKNINYHVVSLGDSCLTRALAVTSGIKPRRMYGEKSCPFDLCFSRNFTRTIDLIKTDFLDFFNDINLDDFPHDENFTFKHFKKRYFKRIQNFIDIQKSDKKIYYIYSSYKSLPKADDIRSLYEVLKSKRNGKPFELIILARKYIDVPDVIQFPYEIEFTDVRTIEMIINKYKDYDNKYTKYAKVMGKKLKEVVLG